MLKAIQAAQQRILAIDTIKALQKSDAVFATLYGQIESDLQNKDINPNIAQEGNTHSSEEPKKDAIGFATFFSELNADDLENKKVYLDQKAQQDYALISLYFLLRYLNQQHADTLKTAVAKECLRLARIMA